MSKDNRLVMPRRTLQQLVHTCQEALSAHENGEDPRHTRDDLYMALQLTENLLKIFVPMGKGAARADGSDE